MGKIVCIILQTISQTVQMIFGMNETKKTVSQTKTFTSWANDPTVDLC